MGVGVMLDVARVIVDRDEPFDNALIFSKSLKGVTALISVWNGGEGMDLLDASLIQKLYRMDHISTLRNTPRRKGMLNRSVA